MGFELKKYHNRVGVHKDPWKTWGRKTKGFTFTEGLVSEAFALTFELWFSYP